jgi:hypothetical protein
VTARIKHADRIAAYYEATVLAGFGLEEAARYFGRSEELPPALALTLEALAPLPTAGAQAAFLARFRDLAQD